MHLHIMQMHISRRMQVQAISASVLIAKFVSLCGELGTNFAI
jgi:hypothetical protein